jgi:F0F1-type ATP synthase membrane subunit b/b'
MSDHLIVDVLKIEEEADNIINDGKQKAEKIVANIHDEIESIKTNLEKEYRQKLELLKAKIADLQKTEEERLRNEFELLRRNILHINSKIMEDAVKWVIKHIYES